MSLNYNPTRDPETPDNSTRTWVLVLIALLLPIGGWAYLTREKPEPAPVVKPRRLAPEGTFYVLSYVSARIKGGVIGFEPGREVHLVKVLQDKKKLVVSDGTYQAEADPRELTNDLDIAELARSHDAASQSQLVAYQKAEKAYYERTVEEQNVAHAKDVNLYNAGIAKNSTVGTYNNPLNKAAEPAHTVVYPYTYYGGYYYNGSPYSYFTPSRSTYYP